MSNVLRRSSPHLQATTRVSSYLSRGAGSGGRRVVPLGSLAVLAYNVAIAADRGAGHV